MTRELRRQLAIIRAAANKTSEARILLCRLLIRLEQKRSVWEKDYDNFHALIEANHFLDVRVYDAFKAAETNLGTEVVDNLGFWAATRIGAFKEKDVRDTVVTDFTDWIAGTGLRPSYQNVDEFLRQKHPHLMPKPVPDPAISALRRERDMYRRAFERVRAEHDHVKAELRKIANKPPVSALKQVRAQLLALADTPQISVAS